MRKGQFNGKYYIFKKVTNEQNKSFYTQVEQLSVTIYHKSRIDLFIYGITFYNQLFFKIASLS